MTGTDTRRTLLTAAAQEILEQGYAASSLSSIAARLGLTKGAFAHHFPAKDDLARALLDILRLAIEEEYARARRAYPASGIRAMIAFILAMGTRRLQDPQVGAAVVLFTERSSPGDDIADLIADWESRLRTLVEHARARGEVDGQTDPAEIADYLVVTTLGGAFLAERSYRPEAGDQRMRLLRRTLRSIGLADADAVVDEVLASRAQGSLDRLPPRSGVARRDRAAVG